MKVAVAVAGTTVSVRVVVLEPALLVTLRVILRKPELLKACVGLRAVLVVPSPKSHCQDDGLPMEDSENLTVCPSTGYVGL